VSAPRQTRLGAVIAGAVLIVGGLAAWALYVHESGNEPTAFARDAKPPAYVQVNAGDDYRIAVHGGVATEARVGISPDSLSCFAAQPGKTPGALNLIFEDADTKATDDIATFVAAVNGRLHVTCAGLGPVFVSNAEDAPFDWSGVWLVLASLALVIGTPLVLSLLRGSGNGPSDGSLADVQRINPAAEEFL
jgi:hypothetical protein